MKIIKTLGGKYYIQNEEPGNLLGYKFRYKWVWAYNIQDLFDFDIDDVEFFSNNFTISDTDIDIIEFNSFKSFKEEYMEYFV